MFNSADHPVAVTALSLGPERHRRYQVPGAERTAVADFGSPHEGGPGLPMAAPGDNITPKEVSHPVDVG
jgi:hypothetical protein